MTVPVGGWADTLRAVAVFSLRIAAERLHLLHPSALLAVRVPAAVINVFAF